MTATKQGSRGRRWLDGVERAGNAVPDPVFLLLGLIGVLLLVSAYGEHAGWSARHPVSGEQIVVQSLLSEGQVARLLTEMPRTYAGFTPFGIVLTVTLGAALAERSGLFRALLRGCLGWIPGRWLTPVTFLCGMLSTHGMDVGYLVFVPLAGAAFAAAGRHPVLGIVVAFSGVAAGLGGSLVPGQYDALLLGITEAAARTLDPARVVTPLGNWWFGAAVTLVFTGLAWRVCERVVAPRLGEWRGGDGKNGSAGPEPLSVAERRGVAAAVVAGLTVTGVFAALVFWPGFTPLRDEVGGPAAAWTPLFQSFAAFFFFVFVASGWTYGAFAGTIRSHRDVVSMMTRGLEPLLPYLVVIFFGAHFVVLFGWSKLGPILAINGAETLRALEAPSWLLLSALVTMSSWLDFLMGSGSAKWTAMAPVVTPMFMLLGVSPEMTTAAYRVGDTVTNLISPISPYVVLAVSFCRGWAPDFRLGSFLALTLPVAVALFFGGLALAILWVAAGWPVGPGAGMAYLSR